jgi:hypothetical protein
MVEVGGASSVIVKHFSEERTFKTDLIFYNGTEEETRMAERPTRSSSIGVRFLPEEKQKLKALAVEQGKTLSEIVRAATISAIGKSRTRVVPEVNRRLYFELGKISELLQGTAGEETPETWSHLQEMLAEIRQELLGLDPKADSPLS